MIMTTAPKTLLTAAAALALLMPLSGCRHKELCYDHPHTRQLRLQFDWRDAPDADPEGMCVFFHPTGGEADVPQRRFDFVGTTGGSITLQYGSYHVVCYNNDTEAVQLRGVGSFATHEGYTRDGHIFEPLYGSGSNVAPRADGADNERVVICPDMLWGNVAFDVVINERGISYVSVYDDPDGGRGASLHSPVKDSDVITLFPHELVCHYSYEIRNVKNIKYATQMTATLSSMAPSLYLGYELLHDEPVTIPFAAAPHSDTATITGQFLTFGHHGDNPQPHKLVLYVWFTDGSKFYYTYDVTDQVHSAPDPRHVHLILDGLDFPQPIANGSGFRPSVDGWTDVLQDIYM